MRCKLHDFFFILRVAADMYMIYLIIEQPMTKTPCAPIGGGGYTRWCVTQSEKGMPTEKTYKRTQSSLLFPLRKCQLLRTSPRDTHNKKSLNKKYIIGRETNRYADAEVVFMMWLRNRRWGWHMARHANHYMHQHNERTEHNFWLTRAPHDKNPTRETERRKITEKTFPTRAVKF